jgi:hypothetical protein
MAMLKWKKDLGDGVRVRAIYGPASYFILCPDQINPKCGFIFEIGDLWEVVLHQRARHRSNCGEV